MSWARLLKRVFDIDVEHCPNCGGSLKIIACPEPSSKGRHRRSAGDRQNPQPPRACPPASRRARQRSDSIYSKRPEEPNPVANASRRWCFA
jgi:hypothetical protein